MDVFSWLSLSLQNILQGSSMSFLSLVLLLDQYLGFFLYSKCALKRAMCWACCLPLSKVWLGLDMFALALILFSGSISWFLFLLQYDNNNPMLRAYSFFLSKLYKGRSMSVLVLSLCSGSKSDLCHRTHLRWYCVCSVLSQVQNPYSRHRCFYPGLFPFPCIKTSKFTSPETNQYVLPCPWKKIYQIYLALLLWIKILGTSFSIQKVAIMDNVWAALLFSLKPHQDGDMSALALSSLGIKTPRSSCLFLSSRSSLSKFGRKSIMEHSLLCWLYISKFVPKADLCYEFPEFLFPLNKILLSKSEFEKVMFAFLPNLFFYQTSRISLPEHLRVAQKCSKPCLMLDRSTKTAADAQMSCPSFLPLQILLAYFI